MPPVSGRQPLVSVKPVGNRSSHTRLRVRPAASASTALRWGSQQPRHVALRLSRPRGTPASPSLIAQLMGAELASRRSVSLGGSTLYSARRPAAQLRQQGARGRLHVRSEADVPSGGSLAPFDPEEFSRLPLPPHPLLHRGHLANGLRYVVLPNAKPPSRFEAHLEIHAGSVDEEDDEQGLAHLVEHVVYMGSRKRERLLGALLEGSLPEPPPAVSRLPFSIASLPREPLRVPLPSFSKRCSISRGNERQRCPFAYDRHRIAEQCVHRLPPHGVPRPFTCHVAGRPAAAPSGA